MFLVSQWCLSLQPHGLQHARPPCPSSSPKVCPSSCPLQGWCHPAISSSDTLFSFCLQYFQAPGTFPMSWLFASKYWSFSISLSNEYSGLISLKIDWFYLLAVQGTFRSLLQHHSLKSSTLWRSAFFTVWLSQQYVITGKTIALTIWTFVRKVMSLSSNTLFRFIIPRCHELSFFNKHL